MTDSCIARAVLHKRYSENAMVERWYVVKKDGKSLARHLFRLSTLGRLQEKHLFLHDGVVLEHGERAVRTGPDHGAVESRHRHGNQADGDSARLRCWEMLVSIGAFRCCGLRRWDVCCDAVPGSRVEIRPLNADSSDRMIWSNSNYALTYLS